MSMLSLPVPGLGNTDDVNPVDLDDKAGHVTSSDHSIYNIAAHFRGCG